LGGKADFEGLLIYATPLAPNSTRVLVRNYLADPGFGGIPLLMRAALAATPDWFSHMTGNAVMDGDGVLLYGQARPEHTLMASGMSAGSTMSYDRQCLSGFPAKTAWQ